MDRKYFRSILQKYLQGRATPEEQDMIDAWYASMDEKGHATDEDKDSTLEKIYWSGIHQHLRKTKFRSLIPWKAVAIAASLLIAVVTSLYLLPPKKTQTNQLALGPNPAEWQEVFNSGTSAQHVALSDGSTVSLEPQSHLRFPSTFANGVRSVYLEGEGFFDVAHNENSAFMVHTKELTTKVLGTSFRVSAYAESKNVTVAVTKGKVSVSANSELKDDHSGETEVILTPNQQIVFDKQKNKLFKMIVEEPQPILSEDEMRHMRFEASPVTEIFRAIEKVYGVDLVFDDETFATCTLTSVITDGDLYKRLDIICKAIGATYSLKEDQIVIDGTGCDLQ